MGLIRVVLEFDVVTDGKASTHRIVKKMSGETRADIETQVTEIVKSVWDGASEEDIAMVISKTTYTLTIAAGETDINDTAKEYPGNEQKK